MFISLKNRLLSDPGLYLLLFAVTVYPLIVIPGPLDNFSGPRYFILAVISALGFWILLRQGGLKNNPAFIPLGLFLLFSFVSTITAKDMATAIIGNSYRFTGLSVYVFCAILFFIAVKCKHTEKVLKYIILGAALVSITAVLQHFGLNIIPLDHYRCPSKIYGTIGNANWLATHMVFTLPAAILSYKWFNRSAWLACAACIYAGLLVSCTRFAWMSFLVTFVFMVFYLRKIPEKRKILMHVLVVFAVVTAILLPTRDRAIWNRGLSIYDEVALAAEFDDRAGSGRMYLWKEAAGVMRENWAFGVGLDSLDFANLKTDKAHNIYLELGATVGVFALISYLVFLSFFLRRWKNEMGFIFFCMLLNYFLQGFFIHDVIMVMPVFWIVLGLTLANRGAPEVCEDPGSPAANRVVNLLAFAVSAAIIISALTLYVMSWYWNGQLNIAENPAVIPLEKED